MFILEVERHFHFIFLGILCIPHLSMRIHQWYQYVELELIISSFFSSLPFRIVKNESGLPSLVALETVKFTTFHHFGLCIVFIKVLAMTWKIYVATLHFYLVLQYALLCFGYGVCGLFGCFIYQKRHETVIFFAKLVLTLAAGETTESRQGL